MISTLSIALFRLKIFSLVYYMHSLYFLQERKISFCAKKCYFVFWLGRDPSFIIKISVYPWNSFYYSLYFFSVYPWNAFYYSLCCFYKNFSSVYPWNAFYYSQYYLPFLIQSVHFSFFITVCTFYHSSILLGAFIYQWFLPIYWKNFMF